MTYNLVREQKVKVWTRDFCTVEADSLEEALQKVLNEDEDEVDAEFLYETIEVLDPYNEGTTLVIADDKGKVLWIN